MKTFRMCLLIDDNPLDNFINNKLIERTHFAAEVVITERPSEALTLLREGKVKPDIIFLDNRMPAMDGFQFLEEYDKLSIDKDHTEIIMLSSSLNPLDIERAKHNKYVKSYFVKSLTPEMLMKLAS